MALKITVVMVTQRQPLRAETVSADNEGATASQVENWLRTHLPASLRNADLTVTVQSIKKDGTPKGDEVTANSYRNSWA
jgi:hypothetical protein